MPIRILLICLIASTWSCSLGHNDGPRPVPVPVESAQVEPDGGETPQPSSATYWVDPLQFKDGSSADKAASSWKSLRRRHDIGPGDVVMFRPGTYPNSMVIELSGREGSPITFRSEKPLEARFLDRIKLRGSHLHLEGFAVSSLDGYGIYVYGDGNRVENCTIKKTKESGVFLRARNAEVVGCEIDTPGTNGIAVEECTNILIEDSYIHDVGRSGLFIYDRATFVTIRGNRIHRSRPPPERKGANGHGIYAKGTPAGKIIIEDNDFIGTGFNQCISLRGPGIVRRNIIRGRGNVRNGIYMHDDTKKNPNSHVIIENNLIYDQGMAALRIGKSCWNWTIEVRNNTLIGTTVGVLLGGHHEATLSMVNNIIGTTGPMKDVPERPECHPAGYVVRHFGRFEALHMSHNLFFNRHAKDRWSNLSDLGPNSMFGDPGYSADAKNVEEFLLTGAKAKLVIDKGMKARASTEDIRKKERTGVPDIGALEH